MGGRIDCYLDLASFYSFIAFADLLPNLPKLAAHGVTVEFHPTLIAGLNQLSGNQPPWKLPAKNKYLAKDTMRAARRVGKPHVGLPRDLMSMALTVSPLRALIYIKAHYPEATFLSTMHCLFERFWTPPNVNLTVEANLEAALAAVTETPGDGGPCLFTADDVRRILDGRATAKDTLTATTGKAVKELGAFGAPWIWATNAKGEGQAFFGSDRFNHIYEYLGVPYRDVEILPAAKL